MARTLVPSLLLLGGTFLSPKPGEPDRPVFPGTDWQTRTPAQVGLSAGFLSALQSYLGGRGALVRHGYLVQTWGDVRTPADVASAGKPLYTHFLFEAVQEGLLPSLDTQVRTREPCVGALNSDLGFKDRAITFRHLATQVSCYGVREAPGRAFDYNDWQMALLWDTLFLDVWNTTYTGVDAAVLRPRLSSILQFQDDPTFLAFGPGDRQGRVAISPRDFCRFGLLYLRGGSWSGGRVLSEEMALTAVTRPLPLGLPRTAAVESDMCHGQRTLGSTNVPDDQYAHDGGYSWTWWVNGINPWGARRWPDAEANVYAAIGHDGSRGLLVVPCLDLVMAWNDGLARPVNEVLRRLYEAAGTAPGPPPAPVGGTLRLAKEAGGTVRLDWEAEGAERIGEHYHVLRGVVPLGLDLAAGSHPHTTRRFSEPAGADPLVFYRVVAATACEMVSDD